MAETKKSSVLSAFEAADEKLKRFCPAGAWLTGLDDEDTSIIMSRLETVPTMTVFKAIESLVDFSGKTFTRHLERDCPCYRTGALS